MYDIYNIAKDNNIPIIFYSVIKDILVDTTTVYTLPRKQVIEVCFVKPCDNVSYSLLKLWLRKSAFIRPHYYATKYPSLIIKNDEIETSLVSKSIPIRLHLLFSPVLKQIKGVQETQLQECWGTFNLCDTQSFHSMNNLHDTSKKTTFFVPIN